MHYLDRSCVPSPACLHNYRHGQHNWCDLSPTDREQIQSCLESMQGRRCAYCECNLDEHGCHIEHFRQRSRYPHGTFEWDNLFWSCEHDDSCGKHKDRCGIYNPDDLIKPDEDDPEEYFVFIFDGSIRIRVGLSDAKRHRAEETLRIMNLDAQWGRLRQMRRSAVSGYLNELKELEELKSIYASENVDIDTDLAHHISTVYSHIKDLPFCTAIKHVLTPQGFNFD